MRKSLLLSALLAVSSVFSVSAEVLSPYTEQFENPTERPRGWTRGGGSSYSAGTYTIHEDGGHSGGYLSVKQYYNTYSSYYKNYSYNDILVTPKLGGEVSIWVRKTAGKTEPSLTIYDIADPNNIPTTASSFVVLESTKGQEGKASNLLDDVDVSDWTKITINNVPEGTYLGIRANDIDIDELTATKAEVMYKASLKVDASKTFTGSSLEAGEDGNVTISFKVTLINDGDVDFPASDPGFKIELVNTNADNAVFGTGYITDAIPWGSEVEKQFDMTGKPVVAPGTVSNNYKVIISHETAGEVSTSLGYLTIIPYEPNAVFMFNESNSSNHTNYSSVDILETINIGAGPAGTSRSLWMWNSGTAPLDVTKVELTGDFEVDTDAFTLAKGEKKEIKISVVGEPGLKEGVVTFTDAQEREYVYDLAGLVTKEGDYNEDFESEGTPDGMVVNNGCQIKSVPVALKNLGGEKYIACSSSSYPDSFITPKLSFGKDEALNFMATKTDNTSASLKVYTSPDRLNWTLVKTVKANKSNEDDVYFTSDKPTGSGYGTYEFKLFSVPMSEGESYVMFEPGGAAVDNLNGGKLVDVAHDLQVVSLNLPKVASVNTRYIVEFKLNNLLGNNESDYKVVMEIDGEQVAETTENPELVKGAAQNYSVRYTPHEVGEFTGKLFFVSGEDRVELAAFDIKVGEEKAQSTYQVGTEKIQTTDPLQTISNCQSQILYRAEQLGMDSGVKLLGFHFNGASDSEFTKHVKVWAQNTEDEKYDFANIVPAKKEDMTLVYEGDYTFEVVGSTALKVYEPAFVINFTTPFVYEGKNLRLMIEQTNPDDDNPVSKSVFFMVDNSKYDYWNDIYDDRVIENKKDYAEDLEDEPNWIGYKVGFPVTYFQVAKDVLVAKGKVTNEFDAPVENATVSFTSNDILYKGVTDAEGEYSINIINVNLNYELTAEAEDYDTFTKSDVTFEQGALEAVENITLNFTDRTATLTGKVKSTITGKVPAGKIDVIMSSGDVTVSAVANEDGEYTLTVPEFTHVYSIEVKVDGDTYANIPEYSFASKADTKDINVEWSGVEELDADDAAVDYYDLNGVKVVNPEQGVYIRKQGNKISKVIIK